MGWSKRQYVERALTEIGLSDVVYNLTPGDLQNAVDRLDAMMASWEVRGIRVSYPMSGTPEGADLDAVTGVPEAANVAIIANLAKQLAPSYGKTVAAETIATARKSLADLQTFTSRKPLMQFPSTLPRGAGQRVWQTGYANPFFPSPSPTVDAGPDSEIEFE